MLGLNASTQVTPDLLGPHGEGGVELVSLRRIVVGPFSRIGTLSSRGEGEMNAQAIAGRRDTDSKECPKDG